MNISHGFTPALAELFHAVLRISWQGALAIVLVLIVRRVLGTRVPARWHYLLWFLVLARLLVPAGALPHSPASLENIPAVARPFALRPEILTRAISPTPPVSISAMIPAAILTAATAATPAAPPMIRATYPWQGWAARMWLGGALGLAAWLAVCVASLQRRLLQETFPAEEKTLALWRACCGRWLRRTPPDLRAADWVDSPSLVGWWRPTLLIPRREPHNFATQDWEHVFAHEIAHLRRYDHWTQLLLLAAQCVHWFNPVVWFGLRRLRADRELAADEWVLRRLEDERALAYGETLFKTLAGCSADRSFRPGMVGISEDGAQMKQRLRRITIFLPQRHLLGSLAGLATVLGLAAVVLGRGASDQQTAKVATGLEAAPTPVSSIPAPAWTEQGLRDDLLAAARARDATGVAARLNSKDAKVRARYRSLAPAWLDDLLRHGEAPAFTTLYDALQRLPQAGDGWKPSDALLLALVKEDRTDALDALMARDLDLKRLSEPAKSADAPTSAWIERRVAEVARQRADIDALEKAAGDGDLDTIRRLLDAGVDVNVVGPDHNTPLLHAVFKNRLEAAQLLLDRGALVDKPRFPGWDYTPLCLVNSVPMAALLKKNGANVHAKLFGRDVSILTYVAEFADSEVVEWFLQQGLDPKMGSDNHTNLLFGLKDGRTARLLLDAGADPNQIDEFGNPPICYAQSGAVAQALLDHGARVAGFKEPLLPNMVSYGYAAADAFAIVLRAGADHDAATIQEALSRADGSSEKDYPGIGKIKQLFLASGAQPTPASEGVRPSRYHAIRVAAADGTLLGGDSTKVHVEQAFGPGGKLGGAIPVADDGIAPVWINNDATAASLAATSDGFATAYAGPFAPPTREKLGGVSFTLDRGFQAAVETVDDAGRPVAGVKLTAYYPGPPQIDLGTATTDAAGRAVFVHVGTAPLTVQASADGYEADTMAAIGLDRAKPYRWTLKKASSLSGVVTAAATGQPVAGARIKLAGVRGPHDETYADPAAAPVLATSGAQGRFTLTSLRPDSVYDLYAEAPGYGGILLNGVRTGQAELKAALGPELTVRGRVIHIPAVLVNDGKITLSYNQFFNIGGGRHAVSKSWQVKAVDGEAAFVTAPLYDEAVDVQVRNQGTTIQAKGLPKSDVVIDFASPTPTPAPVVATPTPAPSASAGVVKARE